MFDKQVLGDRLHAIRKNVGFTQEQVMDMTGVLKLSRYERGEWAPRLEPLVRLADFYGVSLDWLCGRDTKNDSD